MTLDCTGERFLPWMDNDVIFYEHYHRYVLATSLVKGKIVLDMACGEGYGSHMLAKMAKSVVGIDIDKNTIEHARNKYQTDNLTFIQGSILQIPLDDDQKFDVIVCFEAIEHIEDHEKMLSEVKRILKNDGLFIISSPDKKLFSESKNYINPFHKKELYFEEFRELLKSHFKYYKIFGQNVYASSNIWELSPSINLVVKEFLIERQNENSFFSELKKKEPRFFIGIASNNILNDELSNSFLTDISGTLTLVTQNMNLKQHADNLEDIVINRERQINDLKNILINRERQINDLEDIVTNRENKINDLETHIMEIEAKLAKFEEISKNLYQLIRLWIRQKFN